MLNKNYLDNKNITTTISKYLFLNDINSLSHTSKSLYTNILNPEENSILNTNYRNQTMLKFFDEEFNNKSILIDDYKITKNNWLKINQKLEFHSINFPDKKISGIIYELFKDHIYLPDLRKSNKFLEFEYSDSHQNHCYDWLNRISFYCCYYNNENFGIIGKNLFYEKELINYEKNRNEFDIEEKKIIEQIFNYKIENLEKYYINNKSSQKTNQILFFVSWLCQACFLFSDLLFSYLVVFNDKKLIEEYINIQKSFMQFAKAVNEKFKNVNIIINLLYKYQNPEDSSKNYFSLYDMIIKIMKINLYDKLKQNLMKQISEILKNYFEEILNKENINNYDATTDMEIEDENDLSFIENEEMTNKELIEEYTNCILDLNINYFNANLINHTDVKLGKEYTEYENLLIELFKEKYNENIIKLTISDINNIIINFLYNDYSELKIIRRTKNKLLRSINMCSSKFIFSEINNEFLVYTSIENFKGIKVSKILPEENYLNFLSENQKKNVNDFYEEQIENLKFNFKSEIMKEMPEKMGKVDEYFIREDLKIIAGVKNLIWISSFLIGIYNERNEVILSLLKEKKNKKDCNK